MQVLPSGIQIPYTIHLKYEKYYQSIFVAIFELLGFEIQAEVHTDHRRIDAVVNMPETIYLFEFKLFDSAENALKQIKDSEYFQKYRKLAKKVVLIGVAFDQNKGNIDKWLIETL